MEVENADKLRQRIIKRLNLKVEESPQEFEVLTLEEIKKRKKRFQDNRIENFIENKSLTTNKRPKIGVNRTKKNDRYNMNNIKIKTLAEIRAEKLKNSSSELNITDSEITSTNSEVTSTSKIDELETIHTDATTRPSKRVRRKVSSSTDEITKIKPKLKRPKLISDDEVSSVTSEQNERLNSSPGHVEEQNIMENSFESDLSNTSLTVVPNKSEPSKLDEILLLDDDDIEASNVTMKAEEDILKDIDDLLNE